MWKNSIVSLILFGACTLFPSEAQLSEHGQVLASSESVQVVGQVDLKFTRGTDEENDRALAENEKRTIAEEVRVKQRLKSVNKILKKLQKRFPGRFDLGRIEKLTEKVTEKDSAAHVGKPCIYEIEGDPIIRIAFDRLPADADREELRRALDAAN